MASTTTRSICPRQDDFPAFFNARFEALLEQIGSVMGKPVNRATGELASPFVDPEKEEQLVVEDVRQLLGRDESDVLEFKATARVNLHTNRRDPAIEWAVVKTIAGFMNARGGTLLIGADDDGDVVGLNRDYPTTKRGDRDSFELWLTDLLATSLGKPAATGVRVAFACIDGEDLCRVDVDPAEGPVFATTLKGQRDREFFVRINNSTQRLDGQALLEYRARRWL